MFDSLRCEKELPLTEELKNLNVKWNKTIFQTKDLNNCLCNYIITKEGELQEEIIKYEYTYFTEKEKKQKKLRPWDIVKDEKIIEKYNKTIDFHGTIVFYEIFNYTEEEDIWVDFKAYFTYNKLDKIELSEIKKYKSRNIKMEEYWKDYEKKKKSLLNKFKIYSGWYYIWGRLSRFCYSLSQGLRNIQTFIDRHIR